MASNSQQLQQDTNSTTLPPASEPFPGSRTPGWNDPPTLQYNSVAAPTSAARTRLNKRIAFPLQGTTGGHVNASGAALKPTAIVQPHQVNVLLPPAMTLPPAVAAVAGFTQPTAVVHPMPNMNVPPSVARVPASTRPVGPVIALPTDAQEISLRILREQMNLVRGPNVSQGDIELRLEFVEHLWRAGSLSIPVQEKIYRIAKGISDDNFTEAMEIFRSLVANHPNECTNWALALRHIVLTIQPNSSDVESPPTTFTTESSNIAAIPAMPRQIDHGAAGFSSVQHI